MVKAGFAAQASMEDVRRPAFAVVDSKAIKSVAVTAFTLGSSSAASHLSHHIHLRCGARRGVFGPNAKA